MSNTILDLSNGLADAVDAAAPSVVQVHGRRRPASGVAIGAHAVMTTLRALGREDGLAVRIHDGTSADAELAGWDPATGIAVLNVPALSLAPLRRAETPARVGHIGIALGRSWSNAITASAGLISVIGGPLRTGRSRSIEQVIRTNAPVHDGFAGGAFVDGTGALVGLTTAAAIRGLQVVIPGSIAWSAASDVLEHGRPRRGYIGIAGQPIAVPERQRGGAGRDRGVLVVGVTDGGPADQAGVLVGDILIDLGGQPVASPDDLLDLLSGRAGQQVAARLLRGAAVQDVQLAVAERR